MAEAKGRAYERGMQEGLDLRDELRERIAALTEQLGDRDQDVAILTRQLAGVVEMLEEIAADLEDELNVGGRIPIAHPNEIRAFLARLGGLADG